jgi:hypothetical protein
MIIERVSNDRRRDGEVDPQPPADLEALPSLEPHGAATLEGTLCCGGTRPQSRERIFDIVMPSLTHLIGRAMDWGEVPEDESRLGDFRFLVLSLPTVDEIDPYVQLWSEARGNVIIEVGPGDRSDPKLQAFADGIREKLLDRGFEIGGNAKNFRKELPLLTGAEAARFAREMIAIVVDVLGYDGSGDLGCRFEQSSHLSEGHVLTGISRYALRVLLDAWGLRPSIPAKETDVLEARNLYQKFQVQLFCPQAHRKNHFWEVHCIASVILNPDRAATLIDMVNGRPYLFKAYGVAGGTETEQEVRLTQGINLAGGVTPNHIRDQMFEFLERVRKLSEEA